MGKSKKIANNILDLIGETPMIKLNRITAELKGEYFAKIEGFNPGHSTKDRIALYIIEEAERKGILKPGSTIIETTSGNTGFSIAMVSIIKGYECMLAVTSKSTQDKIDMLKAMGANIFICPANVAADDPRSYYQVAKRLHEEIKDSVYINQYFNNLNSEAHYKTTGPEIWEQTEGKIDGFVCSSGTGGTIAGVSSFLKNKNRNVKIYLSDPKGSSLYNYIENGELKSEGGSITEGIGSSRVTANFAEAKIDGAFSIDDHESLPILYDLIKNEGLSLGTSCGVNIAGAIRLAKKLGPGKTIVTILCDRSDRYQSKLFNKNFLIEKKLPYPDWL